MKKLKDEIKKKIHKLFYIKQIVIKNKGHTRKLRRA
jgi:hypothetical protein